MSVQVFCQDCEYFVYGRVYDAGMFAMAYCKENPISFEEKTAFSKEAGLHYASYKEKNKNNDCVAYIKKKPKSLLDKFLIYITVKED